MENSKRNSAKNTQDASHTKEKRVQERKLDEQLEQTFPASDPPSYSQPGHKIDIKDEDDLPEKD